jgi:two-component system OmpR family sensor kinase
MRSFLAGARLGLPIARGLAVAHGGEPAYAVSPAGARFQVRLPAAT